MCLYNATRLTSGLSPSMQSLCETQTCLDLGDLHDYTPSSLSLTPGSFHQHPFSLVPPPNLVIPVTSSDLEEKIEYIPSPAPSSIAPRSSSSAARLSHPCYRASDNRHPPISAARSSRRSSRLSISQVEPVSHNGASIPAQLHDALGKELTENTSLSSYNFLEKLLPPE